MMGTFGTTTMVVEGIEGIPLTIVGMGVEGIPISFLFSFVLILV
jgi:hypothetical protein